MDRNPRTPECPRCGNTIDMETWATPMDMGAGAVALDAGTTVCLSGDCPACEDPLELCIKKSSPDDMDEGVDVWVEDLRDE